MRRIGRMLKGSQKTAIHLLLILSMMLLVTRTINKDTMKIQATLCNLKMFQVLNAKLS